jgi:hypothetical protein
MFIHNYGDIAHLPKDEKRKPAFRASIRENFVQQTKTKMGYVSNPLIHIAPPTATLLQLHKFYLMQFSLTVSKNHHIQSG